ncbi:MAG: beta-ketoacyl synthase N-terminal-like domain-containing protein [bacterium]|nr:beta-ketoacyl synthase N-terminal-like domain-containing protein [bacterium]
MTAHVLGIGTVSALGCGIDSFKSGLEGTAAPLIKEEEIKTPSGRIRSKAFRTEVVGLDRFMPKPKLRRIDNFLQTALMASYLSIEDSGLEIEDKTRTGVIFGSGYGALQTSLSFFDDLIDYGDKCASPTQFANSVHNSLVSNVSINLKLQGPCLTVSALEMTTASVFSTALAWLDSGAVDYVLAGVGDEYSKVNSYAAHLMGAEGVEAMKPFAFDECSYIPGEGFVTFMLGKKASPRQYGRIDKVLSGKDTSLADRELNALFLSANGDKETGRYYKALELPHTGLFSYSALYGGMPVGQGFDLAAAALSLKEGVYYRSSGHGITASNQAGPIKIDMTKGRTHIGCLQYDKDGNCSLISISG